MKDASFDKEAVAHQAVRHYRLYAGFRLVGALLILATQIMTCVAVIYALLNQDLNGTLTTFRPYIVTSCLGLVVFYVVDLCMIHWYYRTHI